VSLFRAKHPDATPSPAQPPRKPRDDEIDVYGLTHTGKVRQTNQDHFLLGSLHKRLTVTQSSLPLEDLSIGEERVAFLMMVADGVGGGQKGEEASRVALEDVTRYISESAKCYYHADAGETDFVEALQEAAERCHHHLIERSSADPDAKGMATTLTLFIGVWPWAYLLQVGDSRYYVYRNGVLKQITRDQTMAEELADKGVMARHTALASRWAHVLSSSIGGPQSAPVVTRLPSDWGNIHVLCSDGLTKHVSNERIAERLASMTSAKTVCEQLLQDALDGGGTDNITIIVGCTVERGNERG
jgi:serine/threonine protein phosphatase PrpC